MWLHSKQANDVQKLVKLSAVIIILGAMLSGPIGTALSIAVKPQPKWQDIETFIQNYHWIQTLPFILGYCLLLGSCLFVAAAARLAQDNVHKIMASLSLISITVYAAMIAGNYTIQIAYVPTAIATNKELLPFLSMTNPSSVSWAVEMFGYMFQGIAFWLLYPVFTPWKKFAFIKLLLMINLLLSIGGAVAACIDVSWAMKPFGLLMFIVWNLVLVILMWAVAADDGR